MIGFLATYYWLFALAALALAALTAWFQFHNIKGITTGVASAAAALVNDNEVPLPDAETIKQSVTQAASSVLTRLKYAFVCGLLSSILGILSGIGCVVAIIDYFKE